MSYQTLLVERDGALLDVAPTRPEKLNAMHPTMFAELVRMADEAVRAFLGRRAPTFIGR